MSWWLRVGADAEQELGMKMCRASCKSNCNPNILPDRQEPPAITERVKKMSQGDGLNVVSINFNINKGTYRHI